MQLTQESLNAIAGRKERERMARLGAQRRFSAEQYVINNRKRRNRALLSVAVLVSTLSWAMDKFGEIEGAKSGEIVAKSELTKAEIKALNVVPVSTEKRNAK